MASVTLEVVRTGIGGSSGYGCCAARPWSLASFDARMLPRSPSLVANNDADGFAFCLSDEHVTLPQHIGYCQCIPTDA